jgi:hypothetical protein
MIKDSIDMAEQKSDGSLGGKADFTNNVCMKFTRQNLKRLAA